MSEGDESKTNEESKQPVYDQDDFGPRLFIPAVVIMAVVGLVLLIATQFLEFGSRTGVPRREIPGATEPSDSGNEAIEAP